MDYMAKVWVLDTGTKGTGAEMVPLEKALEKPARRDEPIFVPPKPRPASPREPAPRQPRKFKVVDLVSGRVLAEGAGARATVDLLEEVRSMVDVTIHVWEPSARRWRPLTLAERQLLWGFRGRR
jgi:hypothetical protein